MNNIYEVKLFLSATTIASREAGFEIRLADPRHTPDKPQSQRALSVTSLPFRLELNK
jgi:hypothetical protein